MKKNTTKRHVRLSLAPPHVEPTTRYIRWPADATAQDHRRMLGCVLGDWTLEDAGIIPQDVALVYRTADVISGDLAVFEIGDDCNIRRFYPQPGGRLRLEKMQDGERHATIYFPGEVKIIGRVLRVDRAGVSVSLAIALRPIREGRAS